MYIYYCIFLISSLVSLFLLKSDFQTVYGDSGFMWIQIISLIKTNFNTFSFQYAGSIFDENGTFAPFIAPFLGSINGKMYIVFTPYFPLLMAFVHALFNSNIAIYLFEAIAFSFSLFFFFLTVNLVLKNVKVALIASFIFFFCTTIFTYNLVIHEYSIAIALLFGGIYFLLKSILGESFNLFTSGILFGLSLYFRLEFIFIIFSWLSISLLLKRLRYRDVFLKFSPCFLLLVFILFALNYYINGHPLGFRYTLTMDSFETISLSRVDIIQELLFGKKRGFFFQSPYLLALIILGFYNTLRSGEWKERQSNVTLFFLVSLLCLVLILWTAPNHGDHLSPRYLFGLYPSLFLFILVSTFSKAQTYQKISKILAVVMLIILFGFSIKQFWKTMHFIQEADKTVALLNREVNLYPQKTVVFLDQAIPKNLQTLFFLKDQYFVNADKLENFLLISKIDPKQILILSSMEQKRCLVGIKFCMLDRKLANVSFFTY